jgi:NAD(P)-dependent dehydrogenase (short-subunit alcohol dehydrogenase family)
MQGRGIVVTGGASGLGLATSKLLAAKGANVAVLDIDKAKLEAAVAEIGEAGSGKALGFAGDIVPRAEAFELYARAVKALGRVDGVVNCAGVYPRRPILEITDEDWNFDWQINVRGTYNIMAAAVIEMRKQALDQSGVRGRIVNLSSVDAFKAHPKNAHYAATKAAVVSLTRSFALEFAPEQILVNSIAPAGIATDKAKAAGFIPELTSQTPLGRAAEPGDIAEWIVFMLSDANRYMTGENVIVSGGYIFA